MPKFQMTELVADGDLQTTRFGAGTGAANHWDNKEVGKPVKSVSDSRHDLCAVGDPIEGFVTAVDPATLDDFTVGTVQKGGRKTVIADGLQATPGTGTIELGSYVVASTAVAKGTALASPPNPKVVKATDQPGVAVVLADNLVATINAGLVKIAAQFKNGIAAWRVVSNLTNPGVNAAVGDKIVIERVK